MSASSARATPTRSSTMASGAPVAAASRAAASTADAATESPAHLGTTSAHSGMPSRVRTPQPRCHATAGVAPARSAAATADTPPTAPTSRRPRLDLPPVSYTHLRAHETDSYLVCRLLLE